MNNLADLLLQDVKSDFSYYQNLYPKRNLPENAAVTRFAPSPTGFVHMGSLYAAFNDIIYTRQSGGVFYLRIEDTDKKREVENGISGIINDLQFFGLTIDEGPNIGGDYGPYIQSERMDIYKAFAKHLIEKGLAYPCFCTEDDLAEIRAKQTDRIGYRGEFAKCRDLSEDEIRRRVENGEKYIIRLKSPGKPDNKITHRDLIKGDITFPENDLDIVIIKSDGLPTYHFAHLADDYLMQTTHVIRGDEWLSSIPIHLQLFQVFGFTPPKYAHIAPLMKEDNGSKRKLSKRHDPECSLQYYFERGIPKEAILLYLSTIANPSFEEWYIKNPDKDSACFTFEFASMPVSGALLDVVKLGNISKVYIARLTAEDVYKLASKYTAEFDDEFNKLLTRDEQYSVGVLAIDRYNKNPRKDIACMADVKIQLGFMYDELFFDNTKYADTSKVNTDIVNEYISDWYDDNDDKEQWFAKIKELGTKYNYCSDRKSFKANPEQFSGQTGDICEMLRVVITGRNKSPDLYDICKLLGKDRIKKRIDLYKEKGNNNG